MTKMTNKREPGYYWVKRNGETIIAKLFKNGEFGIISGMRPVNYFTIDEIGSKITPEMRYTEEDMIEFAKYCNRNYDVTINKNFQDWLKQRKEETK